MASLQFDTHAVIAGDLRWLYVDFNSYFASVEQQCSPALRGKPVMVVPVMTDATSAIAASYEAKALGIKTNTPVYEAKRRCPDIICVLANHERYVAYHQRIVEEISQHVPIDAVCSIDEVACSLKSNENKPDQVKALACRIKQGLAEHVGQYIRCSIGAAPNKYLAKIATDLHKPDGLTLLMAEDIPQRLYALSLTDLPGIGRNIHIRLQRAGIFTVEQLLSQSARQMRNLWGGVWGERMWYMLRGLHVPDVATSRSSVGHSHVLAPELRLPEHARYVARRLTAKAASRLRRLGYYASSMTLSLRTEAGARLMVQLHTEPSQDTPQLMQMLEAGWQELQMRVGSQRVKKLSVTLHRLSDVAHRQTDLFSQPDMQHATRRLKQEKLSRAMDALNHRFGRDTITLGAIPQARQGFSGTKVAFTRIPDLAEFYE